MKRKIVSLFLIISITLFFATPALSADKEFGTVSDTAHIDFDGGWDIARASLSAKGDYSMTVIENGPGVNIRYAMSQAYGTSDYRMVDGEFYIPYVYDVEDEINVSSTSFPSVYTVLLLMKYL